MMTSEDVATIYRMAERRWLFTAMRKRLHDRDRETWKHRFVARAISLIHTWRSGPSRQFVPSPEQQFHDPLLHAAYAMRMSERQVIEMLWKAHQELAKQHMDYVMKTVWPARIALGLKGV